MRVPFVHFKTNYLRMKITDCHTIKDALLLCIEQEQQSYESYSVQAKRTINVHKKSVWEQLANDELRHQTMLTSLLNNDNFIANLYKTGIVPSQLDFIEIDHSSSVKSIIQNAINSEIEAHNEYKDIALHTNTGELQNLFLLLSTEELNHKRALEFELEAFNNHFGSMPD